MTKRAKLTAQLKYEAERVAQSTRQQEERERYHAQELDKASCRRVERNQLEPVEQRGHHRDSRRAGPNITAPVRRVVPAANSEHVANTDGPNQKLYRRIHAIQKNIGQRIGDLLRFA